MPQRSFQTPRGAHFLTGQRHLGPRGLDVKHPQFTAIYVQGKKLNADEAQVYYALVRRGVNFQTQVPLAGGNVLGGLSVDFLLPDYHMDLEYDGPFHDTTIGQARNFWRQATAARLGLTRVALHDFDLPHIDRRLGEILANPGAASIMSGR